jgi:hypothetical protein
MDQKPNVESRPRYRWPWFVLAAVLLAIVLALIWMSDAIRRTREQRDPFTAPATTQAR